MRDRKRLGVVRGGGELRRRLQDTEEVRVLEDDARRALRRGAQLVRVGCAVTMRHLDDLEPEPGRVGLHDLPDLRVRRLGDDDLLAARDVLGDEARVRGDRRAVVAGGIRDVHRQSARRSRSGTRRSPAARPGSALAGTACTRSGTRRAGAPRRRSPERSGRTSRRRGTRARRPRASSPLPAPRSRPSAPARTAPVAARARAGAGPPRADPRTARRPTRRRSSSSIASRSASVRAR